MSKQRRMQNRVVVTAWGGIAIATMALAIAGCGSDKTPLLAPGAIFYGTPVIAAQGQVRSFVTTNPDATPKSIGVQFNNAWLAGLPNTNLHTVLLMPAQAGTSGFDHVAFDWNPQGHPPPGIYDIPHIDFHFFLISPAAADAITVNTPADIANIDIPPAAQYVPMNYIAAPGNHVPGEGHHYIDPTGPEFQGTPHGFDKTFIYGFNAGQLDFIEPMISKAQLLTGQNFSAPIKQPAAVQKSGWYPTSYSVKYDPSTLFGVYNYTITLENLVFRQAS